jgi:hypothetical protein
MITGVLGKVTAPFSLLFSVLWLHLSLYTHNPTQDMLLYREFEPGKDYIY